MLVTYDPAFTTPGSIVMTLTISKAKLAIGVLVVALLAPATAFATHSWPDVDDGRFYADAVAWAKANGMTTGCDNGANFCPERNVTRGENITFAKRYDDLVVQPKFTTIDAAAEANAADIARLDADRIISIGPAAFTTSSPYTLTRIAASPGGAYSTGTMIAPISLPQGAVIAAVTAHVYDDDVGSNMTVRVIREGITEPHETIVSGDPSSGSAGYQSIDLNILASGSEAVDNTIYSYAAVVTSSSVTKRLKGVSITFSPPA
ncbi:MAG: hypothetical protein GY720_20555 [bacterium]|nr:hypothetical protein [bacterium]